MGNGLIDLSNGRLPLSIGDYETAYEQGGLIYESYINTGLLTGITENIFGKYTLPNLKQIDMPNVENIAGTLFRYSNGVEIINAPELTTIGSINFLNLNSVSKLTFPKVLQIQNVSSTNSPFIGCESLEEINLEKCTYIGSYAFNECHNLKEINIINAERIGSYAFKNCYNLEKINLRKIINIDNDIFNGCSKLSEITIGNITSINSDCQIAMYNGPTYSSNVIVTFPDLEYLNGGFMNIYNAMSDYYYLYDRTLVLPNCSEIQKLDALRGYTEVIANKVKTIHNTSTDCYITSLTLNGLDDIASEEFIDFSKLHYVNFKNVKHIGNQAFLRCEISDFYFPECTTIDGLVMAKCYNVYLPKLSELNIGYPPDCSSQFMPITELNPYGGNYMSIGASIINVYNRSLNNFEFTYPKNGLNMPNLRYINFMQPHLDSLVSIQWETYGSYDGSSMMVYDAPPNIEFSNLIDIPVMDLSYSLSVEIRTVFEYTESVYISSAIRMYEGCLISFPKYIGNSQVKLTFAIEAGSSVWTKPFSINLANILAGRLHIDMPIDYKEFKLCSNFSGSLYINMRKQYASWLTFPSKMYNLECFGMNADTLYLQNSSLSLRCAGQYANKIELPNCTYIDYFMLNVSDCNILSMPKVSTIGILAASIKCNSEIYLPNLEHITYLLSTYRFSSPRITLGISDPDLIPRYSFDGASYLSLSKLQYIPSGNAVSAYIDAIDAETINLDSVSYISTYGLRIRKAKSLYLPNLQTIAENYGIQCDYADISYVSLPKIESLPINIFRNCDNLSAMTLPPTCSAIGRNALPEMIRFLRLEYEGVVSLGTYNFAYEDNCVVQVPEEYLSSYISNSAWAAAISNYKVNLIGY